MRKGGAFLTTAALVGSLLTSGCGGFNTGLSASTEVGMSDFKDSSIEIGGSAEVKFIVIHINYSPILLEADLIFDSVTFIFGSGKKRTFEKERAHVRISCSEGAMSVLVNFESIPQGPFLLPEEDFTQITGIDEVNSAIETISACVEQ